ncbi:hypothetical protein [Spirosoma utsteinense]|uniref:hypothetical protein n=1 Tax=Spirosoma utsteinense TaxID=2585773 RepID=UPI00164418E4|nr:hypothetical protein [Spirosoma utsteinense]MBC3785706.1 hypothetical protein [Spirosoma utsteinense]
MTRDNIQYFAEGVWLWLNFYATLFFLVGFALRWMQTYQLSKGHFIVGALAVSSLTIYTVVLGVDARFAHLFWPLAGVGIGLWVFYNDWYYYRYVVPEVYYEQTPSRVQTSGLDTSLGKFLTEKQIRKPRIFSPTGQWLGAALLVLLMGGFGFSQWADAIAAGDRRVVAATQQSTKQVANVKAQVAEAVSQAVDTLTKGQAVIAAVVDSNQKENRSSRNKIESELNRTNSSLNKRLERINSTVDRVRRSPVIPVSPLRPQLITPTIPTSKVQPVPAYRGRNRGRDNAYMGMSEEDIYARGEEPFDN